MRIDIDVRGGHPSVDEEAVRELAVFALAHMGVPETAELSVSVVDPREIQELNAAWRGRDTTTDVLSFPCDDAFADGFADDVPFTAADVDADGEDDDGGQGGDAFVPDAPFTPDGAPLELGDVVICPDIIDEQRTAFSTSFEGELSLMLVHSILHLLGYDHETPEERQAMEQREKEILDAFGLPGLR